MAVDDKCENTDNVKVAAEEVKEEKEQMEKGRKGAGKLYKDGTFPVSLTT